MSNLKMFIHRDKYEKEQTLGTLGVFGEGKRLFYCHTLELEDNKNKKQKSCIPKGIYTVKKRYSSKFGNHLHITNVPGRTAILIHSGNYHRDILGCILIGSSYKHLDKDEYLDIVESKETLKKLLTVLPDQFELEIS